MACCVAHCTVVSLYLWLITAELPDCNDDDDVRSAMTQMRLLPKDAAVQADQIVQEYWTMRLAASPFSIIWK